MMKSSIKRTLIVAMLAGLSSIAINAWAEDAPVYDADNYPPQFDGQSDGGTPVAPAPTVAPSQPDEAPADLGPSSSYTPPPSNLSTEQRIARVEQQINNLQHTGSSDKLNALQTEVQSLRGQVEELTHQLQQVQAQQKSMYTDLDKRLGAKPANQSITDLEPLSNKPLSKPKGKLKTKTPPDVPSSTVSDLPDTASTTNSEIPEATTETTTVAATKPTSQPNVAEEQQIYQTAYDLIKEKKYDQAIGALKGMLNKYPSGQFAANAHYWLGELYGLQNKNDQSAVEFANVVKDYPESPKVSDAQLKLGLIYAAQFKWSDAKTAFKKVINHYPGTTSARLAAEQLKEIKLAGH